MGNGRREGARAKTTNVEFYTIILSFFFFFFNNDNFLSSALSRNRVPSDRQMGVCRRGRDIWHLLHNYSALPTNTGNILLKIDRQLKIDGKKSCLLPVARCIVAIRNAVWGTQDKHVGFRIWYIVLCMHVWQRDTACLAESTHSLAMSRPQLHLHLHSALLWQRQQ